MEEMAEILLVVVEAPPLLSNSRNYDSNSRGIEKGRIQNFTHRNWYVLFLMENPYS